LNFELPPGHNMNLSRVSDIKLYFRNHDPKVTKDVLIGDLILAETSK